MSEPILVSLDIETECGVGCQEACNHALDEHRNLISVVGAYDGTTGRTFRSLEDLRGYLNSLGEYGVIGANFKFDLKTLAVKGLDLSDKWVGDTQLMAATLTTKVSEEYLGWYAKERKRLNELLPRGVSHREGSLHTLKVLAPYFLGVAPFYEDPSNHDNDEYVLKDCQYTYELYFKLKGMLEAEGSYEFYQEKLLPWTRMLLMAERRGITLDLPGLDEAAIKAAAQASEAKRQLDEMWAPAYAAYYEQQVKACYKEYDALHERASAKAKDRLKCKIRYDKLAGAARDKLEPFSLDSPTQMTWLLRDYLKLDITGFDGEETTGKPVLEKLAGSGRADISALLRYRKGTKLSTAFFPSYKAMQVDGALHCSFNPTGTRTGRLSSSRPNLQQVDKGIHHLFKARPGYKLATYDMSAIEPRLIAYYSHDLNLYDILAQGRDFHNYNTAIFFDLDVNEPDFKKKYPKQRDVGKEVALALMYGAGVNRLMESAQKRGFIWGMKEARYKLSRFKEFYEGVYKFRDEVVNPTLMAGESITNLLGRPIRIDDPTNVFMHGLNTTIQGSASDLVLNSAARINKAFKERAIDGHVLLLVHDEIVTEIPEDREAECVAIITDAMTNYKLNTPLGPIELKVEGAVSSTWSK